MKKRRLNKIQLKNREIYKKERKRVLNYISSMKRKGYDVSSVNVPELSSHYTQREISKLVKLTPQKLKEQMIYVNPFTGEFSKANNKVKTKRLRKEFEEMSRATGMYDVFDPGTDWDEWDDPQVIKEKVIIENFLATVDLFDLPQTQERVRRWLSEFIEKKGIEDVVTVLERAAQAGYRLEVNENYPDNWNRSKEIKYFKKTMELSEGIFDDSEIYEFEDEYLNIW